MPDIDIDFPQREDILDLLTHRSAKLENGKKHNTGVYFTEIPHNPVDGVSTIDYKTAEARGYFKFDFLNVSIYQTIRDEEHLQELINREPLWDLLEHTEFVDQVFHIATYGDILKKLKPTNIDQLSAVLAIIRPAKRHLADSDWTTIMNEVWKKPENDQYYFKRSHGYAYALAVVVHMNLLCEIT